MLRPHPSADVAPIPLFHSRVHPVSRRHLDALTGELGILQHANGRQPDPDHGYCVDDVARALEVDMLHARVLPWSDVSVSAWRSLRFLEEAFDEPTGRFGNFRAIDGAWIGGRGSADSFGRAMIGLAHAIAMAPDPEMVARADALFDRALPEAARLTSPRAAAAVVVACALAPDGPRTAVLRTLATDLHARFRSFARPGWPWLEPELTYENALVPQAMIVAGSSLGAKTMQAIGLQVLDWLIDAQTAPGGHLSPIGNGWWRFDGAKSHFDQQPIEATALLLASEAAFVATRRQRYRDAVDRAYAWFLGANDLRVSVADPIRGACADGLTPGGLNTNEGAESTLMWLMAAEHIRAMRADITPWADAPSAAAGREAPQRTAQQLVAAAR